MTGKGTSKAELATTVVNIRHASYDVYIGRPSKWGNPFTHIPQIARLRELTLVGSREEAVDHYAGWLLEQPELMAVLPELKGKRLGCYCQPLRCHGHVLAKLADYRYTGYFLPEGETMADVLKRDRELLRSEGIDLP